MRGSWPVAALGLPKSSIHPEQLPALDQGAPGRQTQTGISLSSISLGAGLCASHHQNVSVISLNEYPSKSRRVHHSLFLFHRPGCRLLAVFAVRQSRSLGHCSSPDCFTAPLPLPRTSIRGRLRSRSAPPLLLVRCGLCLVGQPLFPPQPSRHCEPAGSTTLLPFHATNCLFFLAPGTQTLFQRHGFALCQITSEIPGLAQLPVLSAPLPAHPSETATRPLLHRHGHPNHPTNSTFQGPSPSLSRGESHHDAARVRLLHPRLHQRGRGASHLAQGISIRVPEPCPPSAALPPNQTYPRSRRHPRLDGDS